MRPLAANTTRPGLQLPAGTICWLILSQLGVGFFYQNDIQRRHWDVKVPRDRIPIWEKPQDPSLLRMWEKLFPKEPPPSFKPAEYVPARANGSPFYGDKPEVDGDVPARSMPRARIRRTVS